jgi:hypothetical protein
LVHSNDSAVADDTTSGLEGCDHLGRMVSVVVVDAHSPLDGVQLETTLGATEWLDCREGGVRIDS